MKFPLIFFALRAEPSAFAGGFFDGVTEEKSGSERKIPVLGFWLHPLMQRSGHLCIGVKELEGGPIYSFERGNACMRETISTAAGVGAGVISWLVGGMDLSIGALVICMAVDYVTGLIVAGVFHTSPKTAGGGLDSRVGWKGLARKIVTLLIVVVGNLADVLLGQCCIRDAVVIGFCANECISILENAGLMGIRVPRILSDALEKLHRENDHDGT